MSKRDEKIIHNSVPGLLARLFWMVVGNFILFISTIFILQNEQGRIFHTADVVFISTVVVLIIVRYLDIRFWGGLTVTDSIATMANWRKYALLLLGLSAAVWVISHALCYLRAVKGLN